MRVEKLLHRTRTRTGGGGAPLDLTRRDTTRSVGLRLIEQPSHDIVKSAAIVRGVAHARHAAHTRCAIAQVVATRRSDRDQIPRLKIFVRDFRKRRVRTACQPIAFDTGGDGSGVLESSDERDSIERHGLLLRPVRDRVLCAALRKRPAVKRAQHDGCIEQACGARRRKVSARASCFRVYLHREMKASWRTVQRDGPVNGVEMRRVDVHA